MKKYSNLTQQVVRNDIHRSTRSLMKKTIIMTLYLLIAGLVFAQGTPGLQFTQIYPGPAYSVSRGTADATHIEIPGTYIGLPVTMIANYGFYGFNAMTSISIPNNVTSIGDGAFWNCTGLTSIYIPNSVTSIGLWAFLGCTGLTSITIPNSVTSIGNSAFSDCAWLTSVSISNNLTSLGSGTFYGCTGLTSISIPNSITSIESMAFGDCTGLTSIDIPNSVTTIEDFAFRNCTGLTSVTIGNGVTSMGNNVFSTWTTGQLIPSVNSFSVNSNVAVGAFRGSTTLNSVTIGNSVTSIGDSAFSGCTGMTSVTIGNSVTSIGNNAFRDCTGLTSIEIPDNVTSIGNYAFSGCIGLTSIDIPDSVTSIGNGAFSECIGLTSITIGNSVMSIGNSAFFGCTGLTSIDIPDRVTSIGNSAFSACTGLTSITIGNGVASIGNSAFWGCTGLTSIDIPNSVTSIEWGAFNGCTELASIYIPNSVASIGTNAFLNCSSLTIYAEAESQPAGWHANWNPDNRPVIWGSSDILSFYPISDLQINYQEGVVNLTWKAPLPGSTGTFSIYRIMRNDNLLTYVVATNHNDETITVDNSYTYAVIAMYINPNGESEPVEETIIISTFNPPQNLNAVVGDAIVELSWEAPVQQQYGSLNTYKVYRDNVQLIELPAVVTSFNDNSVTNNVTYTYYITATYVNPSGESGSSNQIEVTLSPIFTINPEWHDFGNVLIGQNSSIQTFTITNTGNIPLIVSQISLTGTNQSDFEVTATGLPWPAIAVNDTRTFSARFTPQSVGSKVAEIVINDNVGVVMRDSSGAEKGNDFSDTRNRTSRSSEQSRAINTVALSGVGYIYNPPTNLIADSGDAVVHLSWNAPASQNIGTLIGYRVYRDAIALQANISPQTLTYTDNAVINGTEYTYYITALYEAPDGESEASNSITAIPEKDTSDSEANIISLKTELAGNYPNPFNPETTIEFTLSNSGHVRMDIFNIRGSLVRTLVNNEMNQGVQSVVWNGKDSKGQQVGSGIYFYQMKTSEYSSIKRMVLMK